MGLKMVLRDGLEAKNRLLLLAILTTGDSLLICDLADKTTKQMLQTEWPQRVSDCSFMSRTYELDEPWFETVFV